MPLEIFTEPNYVELETLTAWPNLGVGETLSNVVFRQLLDRPLGDPAAVATFVGQNAIVPEPAAVILLSGMLALIGTCRREQSLLCTEQRRADLLEDE